jgi:uncharacterized protein YkwD
MEPAMIPAKSFLNTGGYRRLPLPFLIMALCLVLSGAAIVGCKDDDNPVKPNTPSDPIEASVHSKINAYRASQGLGELTFDDYIAEVARAHSTNMAKGTVPFGHDGASDRWKAIQNRIVGALAYGENVAMNRGYTDPASIAVQGWLNSPGHKANIVGDYNMTGIGVAKSADESYYLTQIFIKK